MEIFVSAPQKLSHIVLSQLTSAGYICGTPIPFNMGEVGTNTPMSVCGTNNESADMDKVYTEFERVCAEPWFAKQEMQLRVIDKDGYWATAANIHHCGMRY